MARRGDDVVTGKMILGERVDVADDGGLEKGYEEKRRAGHKSLVAAACR